MLLVVVRADLAEPPVGVLGPDVELVPGGRAAAFGRCSPGSRRRTTAGRGSRRGTRRSSNRCRCPRVHRCRRGSARGATCPGPATSRYEPACPSCSIPGRGRRSSRGDRGRRRGTSRTGAPAPPSARVRARCRPDTGGRSGAWAVIPGYCSKSGWAYASLMTTIGYAAMLEQFHPSDLLEWAPRPRRPASRLDSWSPSTSIRGPRPRARARSPGRSWVRSASGRPPLRDRGDLPGIPLSPRGHRPRGGDAGRDVPRAVLARARRWRSAQRACRRRRPGRRSACARR